MTDPVFIPTTDESICECERLRPPTKKEDEWLQEVSLGWRSKMPPDVIEFEGIGKLNYSFYVGRYVTKIFWRNEKNQCHIYWQLSTHL